MTRNAGSPDKKTRIWLLARTSAFFEHDESDNDAQDQREPGGSRPQRDSRQRLALFHMRERWLAVADLHFGYELSQRAAGNLFPLRGMQTIEARLEELLRDYNPSRLIILGDLVHDGAARDEAAGLIKRLSHQCPIVIIAGNHDRDLNGVVDLTESWQTKRFHFHHGNCISKENDRLQIIGHYHPAGMLADGAGLHLKLPAFVQQDRCWIMPAFSPWAGGRDGKTTAKAGFGCARHSATCFLTAATTLSRRLRNR